MSAAYDQLASVYDATFSGSEDIAENQEVFKRLNYTGGSVLDVGCGTGLFLDYVKPDAYLGVDPSTGMILELLRRHPGARTVVSTFEHMIATVKYDVIVSLFGSISYVYPASLIKVRRMLNPGGRFFLMFIGPGYTPRIHQLMKNPPPMVHRYERGSIPGAVTSAFADKYTIVEGSA